MGVSDEPVVYLTKKTWQFSKGNRAQVVLYTIMFVIANLIDFVRPLVIVWLLDIIQIEGVTQGNIAKLLWITSSLVGLMIAYWLLHGPARVIELKNAFLVRANYKKYLVDGVLDLPSDWHAEHHSGDTIDKIEKGSRGIFDYSGGTYEVIETIIRLAGSVFALFYFNLSSGFLAIFFIVMAVIMVLEFDKDLRQKRRALNHAENATSQKIFDIVSNISTIIILRVQKIASSQIFRKIMDPFGLYKKFTNKNELKWGLVSFSSALMTFSVLAAYFIATARSGEVVLIGTVYALYGYVDRISSLFYRFAYKYSDIVFQKTAVENAEEIAADFRPASKGAKVPLGPSWTQIEIKHLTFSYNTLDTPDALNALGPSAHALPTLAALPATTAIAPAKQQAKQQGKKPKREHLEIKDTALQFRHGEKIALVGESGSGKTTFLKLMRGLYEPSQLDLEVDGMRLPGFDAISDDITLIPQEPELFTTTIKENLTMGLDYEEERIGRCMDIACFTSVALRLPRKLESSIKERGVNLSGEEKQRLALARGLLACEGKEIILLDEPTSSVDSKNELLIHKGVFEEFKEQTIFSSIHRLHLLPLFDTIYFFKDGRIVARGTLRDVLRDSKDFQALWKRYHQRHKKAGEIDRT